MAPHWTYGNLVINETVEQGIETTKLFDVFTANSAVLTTENAYRIFGSQMTSTTDRDAFYNPITKCSFQSDNHNAGPQLLGTILDQRRKIETEYRLCPAEIQRVRKLDR